MTNQGPKTWSTSGIDLLLEPAHVGVPGLRARVEEGLREAIRSGRLARGTRLPPTRTLARDLGVSRGTIQQAYAQLAAEGWIAARHGSGTLVAFDSAGYSSRRARLRQRTRAADAAHPTRLLPRPRPRSPRDRIRFAHHYRVHPGPRADLPRPGSDRRQAGGDGGAEHAASPRDRSRRRPRARAHTSRRQGRP